MASSPMLEKSAVESIAIHKLAHRYLLYDVHDVTNLRQKHNICGVLIGSLPQASQQNVFLGLPLELMPEEARLLVEKGVAHVVDDVSAHKRSFLGAGMSTEERRAYQAALRKQGQGAAVEANKRSNDRKQAALQKLETENWNDIPDDMFDRRSLPSKTVGSEGQSKPREEDPLDSEESLFAAPVPSAPQRSRRTRVYAETKPAELDPYAVTPTTSYPPLRVQSYPKSSDPSSIDVPSSYPLYRHLHADGYFLAPGLRFGCQYMAYPGDPLRFHSHFLCNGLDWDEEFDLIDLIGGGRLGTGVKKGFLLGGEDERTSMRTFCIEWGGM